MTGRCHKCGTKFLAASGGVCNTCESKAAHTRRGKKRNPTKRRKRVGQTLYDSLELLQKGLSPEQIAERRGLQPSTVYGHLEKLLERQELKLESVVSKELQLDIQRAYHHGQPPLDVQDVQERMEFEATLPLIGLGLRALHLELGRGEPIAKAEKDQIEDTILQAVGKVPGAFRERSLARLLLGSRLSYKHTEGEFPFGALKGYDIEAVLGLIDALLDNGKLMKIEDKLHPAHHPTSVPKLAPSSALRTKFHSEEVRYTSLSLKRGEMDFE